MPVVQVMQSVQRVLCKRATAVLGRFCSRVQTGLRLDSQSRLPVHYLPIFFSRRDGRAADCGGLENR